MTDQPAAVYWRGEKIALTRTPARILSLLAVEPYVSIDTFMGLGIKSINSLQAHVTAIRRALPHGIELENDFGKGYRLIFR